MAFKPFSRDVHKKSVSCLTGLRARRRVCVLCIGYILGSFAAYTDCRLLESPQTLFVPNHPFPHQPQVHNTIIYHDFSLCGGRDEHAGGGGGKQRMLRLKVTDGKVTAVAVEYRRISQLDSNLAPGTKLLFTDATVQSGIAMLQDRMVKVLGGRVDSLADEWEVCALKALRLHSFVVNCTLVP
eukprot:3200121-Pyramimonas_sp.AAC.1